MHLQHLHDGFKQLRTLRVLQTSVFRQPSDSAEYPISRLDPGIQDAQFTILRLFVLLGKTFQIQNMDLLLSKFLLVCWGVQATTQSITEI